MTSQPMPHIYKTKKKTAVTIKWDLKVFIECK